MQNSMWRFGFDLETARRKDEGRRMNYEVDLMCSCHSSFIILISSFAMPVRRLVLNLGEKGKARNGESRSGRKEEEASGQRAARIVNRGWPTDASL
jgi:hypothetical protein